MTIWDIIGLVIGRTIVIILAATVVMLLMAAALGVGGLLQWALASMGLPPEAAEALARVSLLLVGLFLGTMILKSGRE